MKNLSEITQEQVNEICLILGESCLDFGTNKDIEEKEDTPIIFIQLKSTAKEDRKDEELYIYTTGKVIWLYNDGKWGGSGYNEFNTLPITDYLRAEGYQFKY